MTKSNSSTATKHSTGPDRKAAHEMMGDLLHASSACITVLQDLAAARAVQGALLASHVLKHTRAHPGKNEVEITFLAAGSAKEGQAEFLQQQGISPDVFDNSDAVLAHFAKVAISATAWLAANDNDPT